MTKKIICMLLCVVMAVGCLAACGNKNVEDPTTEPTVNENPTEAPTDEVTEPVEDEVTEPSEEETEPVEDEVTEPVVADVDEKIMAVFTDAQAAMSETWRANMEIPVEMYADMFGLDASTYTSIYGMMPMMSAHVDTLVGVKAVDAAGAEAIKAAFETYVEGKKADRMQYPTNAAAMGAMKVVVVGDYVWLVGIFGDTDSVAESGEEAILEFAQNTVASVEEFIMTHCGAEA